MKSILMSIQPYWGFLIIANGKGWDLEKYGLHEKTVEARKGVPTSPDWDKKVALYFSKNKKSLARIPEEYRGEVAKLCGKVVGEFVCDKIDYLGNITNCDWEYLQGHTHDYHKYLMKTCACLTEKEVHDYFGHKSGYGLHISDLKIYDKPKELREFRKPCTVEFNSEMCRCCDYYRYSLPCWGAVDLSRSRCADIARKLTRPPQSWQFVEEL